MFVDVVGGSKSQKTHVHKMVEFCVSKLMPKMNNLDITVHLTKPQGAMGYCCETDDNRTFEIEIQKGLSFDEIVKTVCHEMVHVKQYARNEMTDSTWKGKLRWRNRFIKKNTSYSKLPWEREAYRKQKTLSKSYYKSKVD